jgi:hypothetical protein
MKIFITLVFLFSITFVARANNYSPEELKQLGDQIRSERLKNEIEASKAKFHFDLQFGYSSPLNSLSNYVNSGLEIGGQVFYSLDQNFNLGIFYTSSSNDLKKYTFINTRFQYYGFAVQYYLPIQYLFLQVKAGFSTLSASAKFFSETYNFRSTKHPFISSIGAGIELPISSVLSFVPLVSYIRSFKCASGTNEEIPSYGFVEGLVALRFNF